MRLRIYYKLLDREIIGRTHACDAKTARRRLRVGEEYANAHLYDVVAESRLPYYARDPQCFVPREVAAERGLS